MKKGIDVLEAHGIRVLKQPEGKKRIGLVTNQTGVDADGRPHDRCARAGSRRLPRRHLQPRAWRHRKLDTTDINNSKDAATGVPVYSVYGETRRRRAVRRKKS